MPRSNNVAVQNNFIKGLITEATALTFPPNACTDADNCVFHQTGIAYRRLGFDLEDRYDEEAVDPTGSVISSFLWRNVAGEGDIYFIVVQVGDTLYFYRVSDTSLSASLHATTIDLTDYAPSGVTTVKTLECQFSSGNGLLFVTNPRLDSFYVSYDPDTDAFTDVGIGLEIRDFEGDTADTYGIDQRVTSNLAGITAAHRYNLQNQGWTTTTLTDWDTARTDIPSNSDVSWYFKDSSDAFDFSTVDDRAVGNSYAPKGHYIYSPYNINRSSNFAGATDFAIDIDRVATSAFFAGRVFFSGLGYAGQNSKIFFSQIVEGNDQYGKCYQANDPTSEQLFDLLPSDGGVINLTEAGSIIKLFPVLNTLLVFATNGVWAITGNQGVGFTASDYAVNKISSIPAVSHTSFIDVEGVPYWWNFDGVHTVIIDPQTNSFRVDEITAQTIKTFFQDFPVESKLYSRGTYDPFTKTIQWIYKSNTASGFESKYVFDSFLIYNQLSNAWYTWTVDTDNVKIHSIVDVLGLSGSFEIVNVTDNSGADNVVDGVNNVVAFVAGNPNVTSTIKYYVTYDNSGTQASWAENYKTTYLDWESFDDIGQEYDSFFVTGYMIPSQGIKRFQTNYVNVFSKNEVNNSFQIQGQWNYSTADASNRWSTSQMFTNIADDFLYKTHRVKIRGTGIACQFRITNNSTNPFFIVGWSTFETGNQWV
jgi:hypothetical protein